MNHTEIIDKLNRAHKSDFRFDCVRIMMTIKTLKEITLNECINIIEHCKKELTEDDVISFGDLLVVILQDRGYIPMLEELSSNDDQLVHS